MESDRGAPPLPFSTPRTARRSGSADRWKDDRTASPAASELSTRAPRGAPTGGRWRRSCASLTDVGQVRALRALPGAEEVDGLGIAASRVDDVLPSRAAAARIGAHRSSADGDMPDGTAAQGDRSDSQAADREQGADGEPSKGDEAQGDSTKREDPARKPAEGEDAGGDVSDRHEPLCVAAELPVSQSPPMAMS